MRFLFLLVCSSVVSSLAFSQAQTEYMTQTTRDRINFTNLNISNNPTLFSIKGQAGQLIGSPYLDTTWQAGNVKFYNKLGVSLTADSLAGVPVRLDLSANEVEIRAGEKNIKAVKATAVRYVDVNNLFGTVSRYINVHEYQGDAQALTGFFEQLAMGKLDLLLHPSVYIRRANYNVALNTGTKDDELMKKQDWYVARDKQATKFSPGKKAILELMADKKEQMEAFLKMEKPDLKSRVGLLAVFSFYNKL
ncbi:hypothetical protein [Spirosoma radiotolerans]|uniref:Uncharacterized protein n=1 Tax=Spirosoma radiotolerans TaxID=1379870 RepID=A0A0E3V7F8_9BACT|nr:hypothetical protein [Spirosoma radiotolerans]AKD55396.1 hypothetical protein SD10_11280 [Spirosoma radiotolerans]